MRSSVVVATLACLSCGVPPDAVPVAEPGAPPPVLTADELARFEDSGEGGPRQGRPLTEGYVALQSESHPIQFRQVLLRPLTPGGR